MENLVNRESRSGDNLIPVFTRRSLSEVKVFDGNCYGQGKLRFLRWRLIDVWNRSVRASIESLKIVSVKS